MNDDRQAKRESDAARASKRAKQEAPARKTRTIESGTAADSERMNGEGTAAPRKRAAAKRVKAPAQAKSENGTARRPRKPVAAPSVSARESDVDGRDAFPVPARELSPEERHRMIQRLAYFRAEWRGWTPGAEMDDWLHAEREVDDMLRRAGGG